MTPEIMAFLKEPRPLIIAKANIHARVHRRVYLDYIGVKHFDAAGKLVGELRIVGLFTSTAYTRAAHGIPYLRRKLAAVDAPRRLRSRQPFGQGAGKRAGELPARRAVPDRRGHALPNSRSPSCSSTSGRACACCRGATASTASSRSSSTCRASATTATSARKIGDYLAAVFIGRVSASYPFFPEGPLVRVHYIIGRSGGAAARSPRAKLESEVADIVRTWTDGLSDALTLVYPPDKARELFGRYRDAFSAGYPRRLCAGGRRRRHSRHRGPHRGASARRRFPSSRSTTSSATSASRCGASASRCRCPTACRCWRTWASASSTSAPIASSREAPRRRLVPRHAAGARATAAPIDLDAGKARLEAAFLVVMRGQAENDGYNALVLDGGLGWRDVALIRTLSRYLRQVRVPYSQDYMWATLVKHCAIAAEIVALFHARFDPRARRRRATRKQARDRRADREALDAVDSLDEDRILRQFVNAVQAAVRTNFYQIDKDGQPKPKIAIKFESRKLDRAAAAAAALRDFRLFAARRRRASALRQGGARRHPLVRPAAGFPHRGARPGQGAAGQERRHRAGRRQGRLRAQADADERRRASSSRRRASPPTNCSSRRCSTSPTIRPGRMISRPTTSCATTATIPISSSRPTRAPRPSPTSPTGSPIEHGFWLGDAFASGGSAGYDHKAMGITARGASESISRKCRLTDSQAPRAVMPMPLWS